MYLAITQGTAEWILPKVALLDGLHEALPDLAAEGLNLGDFAEGPIKIFRDESKTIVALLHADYILGAGDEPWGFIKLSGELSLLQHPEISRETLERSIYVVNQRLRGLLIDGAYYHRKYENGAHTLLAGRGSLARHYSIAYVEKSAHADYAESRTVICIGPGESFAALSTKAEKEGRLLPRLTGTANRLLTHPRTPTPSPHQLLPGLRAALAHFREKTVGTGTFSDIEVVAAPESIKVTDSIRTMGFRYEDWEKRDGPLNDTQKRILNSFVLDQHPLRIIGPAGSGKTLLMQLLAIKLLKRALASKTECQILYVVHSEAMREKVHRRFEMLVGGRIAQATRHPASIVVTTLAEYCRTQLQLEIEAVLDRDAADAKTFQLEQVGLAISALKSDALIAQSRLLRQIFENDELLKAFAWLTLTEISVSIKGHGLENDKKQYVETERKLSRFHGILSAEERSFIFEVFRIYHREVFESYSVLDPDDIALSLSGRLRTPVWQLRRRTEGFDYVFVDEAQLFNENEKRVLPLLTKGNTPHVPIALALDEAQALYGQPTAGLATLGIKDIANESLASIHRSTTSITKLAFFVIQRSTDLFGPEFPDFTGVGGSIEADKHPTAAMPLLEAERPESPAFAKFLLRRVRDLRRENVRQIAIICHAEQYWSLLETELAKADLPFQVLRERGEKIRADQPIVVLCRPAQVGGQEFDAVIIVGLELGLMPPRVQDNEALATAVEQQSIRETYLSISRARYRVVFVIGKGASPNTLLQESIAAGLISSMPPK